MPYQRGPYGGAQVTLAFPPFTPMVRRILWVLGVAFVLEKTIQLVWPPLAYYLLAVFALDPQLRIRLIDVPLTPPGVALWQLLTYALLHGGLLHILFNGLGVWMFGGDVERVLGSRGFLRFFVVCVLGGGVAVVIGGLLSGSLAPVIGASGGVMGLLLAFAMFFPERRVFIFPIPVPVPAWLMALIFGLLTVYGAMFQGASKVAYAAHLGGLVVGYLYLRGFIKPGAWTNMFRRRRSFRVVPGERRDPFDVN